MGRLLFNVLGMVTEFESDLMRMRTREGMAVNAEGRLRGKTPKLSAAQEERCSCTIRAHTTSGFAEPRGGARSTVYRAVQRADGPRTTTLES